MAAHVPRPDHAFVGNHTYSIEWLDVQEWEDRRLDDSADAMTHARHQTIQVRVYGPSAESHYQEVLLHELLHTVWDSTMLTHQDLTKQDDAEEFVISMQSPPLLFILKQNPDLVKWLLSDGTVVR